MKNTENALVILAGGNGSRFRKKLPKQFTQINGENLIEFFLKRIDTNNFDKIVIVSKVTYVKFLKKLDVKIVTSIHNKYKTENILKRWYNNHLLRGDHIRP